jgi:protein sex-lethal
MRDSKSGYSYGFGFVNFDSGESAARAREFLNGFQVGNKRLKVSIARPPSEDIKGTNLFITNLPKTTTTNNIYEWFGRFGKIVQHNILVDKVTNEPRGVGFVRFEKRDEANEALKGLHGGFIPLGATNPIRVKIAEEHGKQKAAYLAGFKAGIHQKQTNLR